VRLLRIAAALEAVTLVVLLLNLATVHVPGVASLLGPVHGAAYLTAIVAVLLHEGAPSVARWWAVVPGVGGLLAVRRLRSDRRDAEGGDPRFRAELGGGVDGGDRRPPS
jgi:hypothetical protein